jgi:hypothetical protein
MNGVYIHRVAKVVVEDIKEQFSNSFVRSIFITDEDGKEFELVLFSRKYEGLEPVSDDMEDWK